jgi:hypothetical protein
LNEKHLRDIISDYFGLLSWSSPARVNAEWEDKTIRVLDPISLLACKLELAAKVSQEKRKDVTHLKILPPCVRSFLGELLLQVEYAEIPAKDWLKVTNRVLRLTHTNRALKLARKHQINWTEILPLTAIAKSQ